MMACLLTACVTDSETEDVSLGVGDPCPEFSVTLSDGRQVSTASLRGKQTLILFFNTECGDCRREIPVVQQAYERLTADLGTQPQFLCIARSEGEASVSRFWGDNALTMPVAPQSDASVYHLFASIGIPRIYIISPEGIITATWSDNPMATADQICAAFGQ